jgi:hypothetical protein
MLLNNTIGPPSHRRGTDPVLEFRSMPSFVITYAEGFPDEIEADRYEEQEGDVVFLKDGSEVFRVHRADAVSIHPRDGS